MGKLVLVLLAAGITIYAAIDCLRSDESGVRGMPKALWLLVIVLLAPFGGVLWVFFGRVPDVGGHSRRAPRTIAPDDDPDFLRSLRTDDPSHRSPRDTEGDDHPTV